jgi:hypothetical protein
MSMRMPAAWIASRRNEYDVVEGTRRSEVDCACVSVRLDSAAGVLRPHRPQFHPFFFYLSIVSTLVTGTHFASYILLSETLVPTSTSYSTCLDAIHTAGSLNDIVGLIGSYLMQFTPPASALTTYLSHIVRLPTLGVPLKAVLTSSRISLTYVPRLIRDHPCRWHTHRHR